MDNFAMGLLAGVIIAALIVNTADVNFDYREKQYLAAIKVCSSLKSTPKSYDTNDLTCMNGAVVDNFVLVAEKLNGSN